MTTKEPLTKQSVIIIVGSMLFGAFGTAMVVFNLIADHKISQMEARMVKDFALVREIESLKARVVGMDAKIGYHHRAPKEDGP